MAINKAEARRLFDQLNDAAVSDETPEEAEAAEAEARKINRLCDAIDDMTPGEHRALENRLRRQARRKGLRLKTLPEGDAHRFGDYRYRLVGLDEYVVTVPGERGLHLGEVQFLLNR